MQYQKNNNYNWETVTFHSVFKSIIMNIGCRPKMYFWISHVSQLTSLTTNVDHHIDTQPASGHYINFCGDLPHRASEIQFSLALLQLSFALENLYNHFIIFHLKTSRTWFWHVKAYFLGQAWMADHKTCTHSLK